LPVARCPLPEKDLSPTGPVRDPIAIAARLQGTGNRKRVTGNGFSEPPQVCAAYLRLRQLALK
jgi:hypothetical protein